MAAGWRRPDGSVHVVGHNEKAKAETAKAKAEEERLRRVREERAREEQKIAAYRAKSIEEWGKVIDGQGLGAHAGVHGRT